MSAPCTFAFAVSTLNTVLMNPWIFSHPLFAIVWMMASNFAIVAPGSLLSSRKKLAKRCIPSGRASASASISPPDCAR